MRINLTKKEIVNSIYMQIGYSKKISEKKRSKKFLRKNWQKSVKKKKEKKQKKIGNTNNFLS